MLTIQIKDGDNKVVAVINDIFSLQVDDEVNKGGKIKIKFPVEDWLQKNPISKGYRLTVSYGIKIGQVVKLFDGYITDITLKTKNVELQAENWLSYLQNRIIRVDKSYTNESIKNIVSGIFTEINTNFTLPITLGLNDCDTTITQDFSKGTSFYDILKKCWEAEEELVVRIIDGVLEVSKNTGTVLEGVWEYDVQTTDATNIVDWSWKDSMDNFFSYLQNDSGNISDSEFNADTNLIFEKYDKDSALVIKNKEAIPSVSISRDTDWWDFNIGDRKYIKLYTGYERLLLEYLGLIQSRKITINANGGIKAEIKISEKYKSDTNILDLLLVNLRK